VTFEHSHSENDKEHVSSSVKYALAVK